MRVRMYLKAACVVIGTLATFFLVALLTAFLPGFEQLLEVAHDVLISPFWAIVVGIFILREGLRAILLQIGGRLRTGGFLLQLPGGTKFESQGELSKPPIEPGEPVSEQVTEPKGVSEPIKPTAEDVQLLRASIYELQYSLWAEEKYRVIYGSQISALRQLNMSPARALPRPMLESTHKTMHTDRSGISTFDQWLSYLVTTQMVEDKGESISITHHGIWFLGYLTRLGLSEYKVW